MASVTAPIINFTDLIESSFPGIGKSIPCGSLFVSIIAATFKPVICASLQQFLLFADQ